jgi:hypothetical protein
MADTKISALPASTTPLAGAEVLPIVQSGATKQVSVANLTAGRAISATELTLSTGNLIIGTSGKGIDFSATSGTGTSELLSDYEEGTWTPADASGAGLSFSVIGTANYIKVGKIVTVQALITYPTTASGGNATIGGLPYAAANTTYAQSSVFTNSGLTFNTYLGATAAEFDFRTNLNANISNASLSTKFVLITLIYQSV